MSITKSLWDKLYKGKKGEEKVLESLTKLLRGGKDNENFFLMNKYQIEDLTTSREIDVVLLHPTFGLFVIEVKNWAKLDISKSNPFEQAKNYQRLLMAKIEDKLGSIPINIEHRVVFPTLSKKEGDKFFEDNTSLSAYKNSTFFKEDLESKESFSRFFYSNYPLKPNTKSFNNICSVLIDKKDMEKKKDKVMPIITKDEILFFDYNQLSVLNGYTEGFKIIRGVAGTGKTVILSHYVNNKLERDPDENYLILCFNTKLVNNVKKIFKDNPYKENININSIFGFIKEINFEYACIGLQEDSDIISKFEGFEKDEAIKEFREKLKIYLRTNPIDYMLCDETQDMPEAFMRVLYEEIHNCIFFIDEAQKFYTYSMDSIAQVFHHPKFEKINMSGKVSNLKNVYRTPSNIAKSAFEILSYDKKINKYYKGASRYLTKGKDLLTGVNFILEDGSIHIDNWNDFKNLEKLIEKQTSDTIILTYSNAQRNIVTKIVKDMNKADVIKVMNIQAVKGLEAETVIIHSFDYFMNRSFKSERDIFYRKLYVLLTRAQKNIYLSIDPKNIKNEEVSNIINILDKYSKNNISQTALEAKEEIELLKVGNIFDIKPKLKKAKEIGEYIVVGAEVTAASAGFLSFIFG